MERWSKIKCINDIAKKRPYKVFDKTYSSFKNSKIHSTNFVESVKSQDLMNCRE